MPLKIIDSSTLPLNLTNHPWAKFRKIKADGATFNEVFIFLAHHRRNE